MRWRELIAIGLSTSLQNNLYYRIGSAWGHRVPTFFIDEARKNDHAFDTPAAEQAALLYNYALVGDDSLSAYFFEPAA